ncbi:MAG: hypothetical protein WC586_04110 [Methanoregula sp.]
MVGIIIICIILTAAILAGSPFLKTGTSASSGQGLPVSATPTGYAIVSTLGPENPAVPSSTPAAYATTVPVTTPTSRIVDSEKFGSDYERVYSISKSFSFGQKESFSQNVTTPPLYIRFDLSPAMINRHILVGIGTSQEHMVNNTVASPNAWFEVDVYDAADGRLVEQQGFGKDFSDMTKQEFMVRQKGNYRIEMSGHEVFANVSIMTGLE